MDNGSEFSTRALQDRPSTVVGAGVIIRGDIEGVTDLHVHGSVIGKVTVGDLIVDRDARIDGPVTAEAVSISGRVIGPIKATTIHLFASARLEGDVACESIRIESGARFVGQCNADDGSDATAGTITRELNDGYSQRDTGQELLSMAARLRRVAR